MSASDYNMGCLCSYRYKDYSMRIIKRQFIYALVKLETGMVLEGSKYSNFIQSL